MNLRKIMYSARILWVTAAILGVSAAVSFPAAASEPSGTIQPLTLGDSRGPGASGSGAPPVSGSAQGPGVTGGSGAQGPSIYNPSGNMLMDSTPITGQEVPMFDGGSLTMLSTQTGAQMLSVLLQSKEGGLVVVDGGWEGDADYLLQAIMARGGHVHAWLITHPDFDHAGALYNILARADSGIAIDHIYVSMTTTDWYYAVSSETAPFVDMFRQRLALQPEGMVVDTISSGYQIPVPGIQTTVLNNAFFGDASADAVNNSSVVYRIDMNGVRMIFLGDLAELAGNILIQSLSQTELKADIVQMAHHGQSGVGKAVYETIAAPVCLWPTPLWLWNNDAGSGYGSGSWKTLETRGWIQSMGVTRNYVMKDGDIILR